MNLIKINTITYYLESKNIITFLRVIDNDEVEEMFGQGIVKKAFKPIDEYYKDRNLNREESLKELEERVELAKRKAAFSHDIAIDDLPIIIEFFNGNLIEFGCSEYGYVERLNKSDKQAVDTIKF